MGIPLHLSIFDQKTQELAVRTNGQEATHADTIRL